MNLIEKITSLLKNGSSKSGSAEDDTAFLNREKAVAFLLSFIFAFCLWFIINLNRDFTVNLNLPVVIANMPDSLAPSTPVPGNASANLNGEGWQLISLYNNPPQINLNIENEKVNILDQLRQQLGVNTDVSVVDVQPVEVELKLENRVTKKVPVVTRTDLTLGDQYGIIGRPDIEPDSVTISGAASKLANINVWETEPVEMKNIQSDIERSIKLVSPDGLIRIEPDEVVYKVEVSEFTEGETRVPVRTRNLPPGKAITYSPSTITITYSVPIGEYSDVQDERLYSAFVDYEDILRDNTGFVVPEIVSETNEFNIRLKRYEPSEVAYFNIVND